MMGSAGHGVDAALLSSSQYLATPLSFFIFHYAFLVILIVLADISTLD